MEPRRSPFPMPFAFVDPQPGGGRSVRRATVRERPAGGTATALVVTALVWLLLGCSGLLWVIAFTRDPDSLVLALAVWGLAFVGPSLCATSCAYRLDPDTADDQPRTERRLAR